MTPKKILYLLYFDAQGRAGGAIHARGVVSALARLGHQLRVLAPGWPAERESNISLVRTWQLQRPGFYTLSYTLFSMPLFLVEIVRNRPDVVYARYFNLLFVFAVLTKWFRIPLFVEHNADLVTEHELYGRRRFFRALHEFAERSVLANCTGSIAVTRSIVDGWRSRFVRHSKIAVIHNGVDAQVYRPLNRIECRAELSIEDSQKVICYLGSFSAAQGLDSLVSAFELVRRQFPTAMLLLVGGGAHQLASLQAELLRRQLVQYVRLVGWVEDALASKYIGASDVCVAPYSKGVALTPDVGFGSPMKGDPLKIYSYMACGRPVVASHFQEAGRQVQEIGAGIATPPENPPAIARAICTLLNDEPLAALMGERARKFIDTHATWDLVADKTTQFMLRALSGRSLGV